MSSYTPNTVAVRANYVQGRGNLAEGAEFDRWLAKHDAKVKEEAWDEGYEAGVMTYDPEPNPYRNTDTKGGK